MTRRTRRRSSARVDRAGLALGVLLPVVFVGVALGFGGVKHEARAFGHVGLAVLCVTALFLPSASLAANGGRALRWLAAGLVLLAGLGTGLLPIPAALGRWIAPLWEAERGAVGWDWSSLDPEATLTALSGTLLPIGVAVIGVLWASWRDRRTPMEDGIAVGTAVMILVASVHVGSGTPDLFGTLPSYLGGRAFFAPFINVNHFGSAMLLVFPFALAGATDPEPARRPVAAALTLGVLGLTLWSGSAGPLLVMCVEAVVLLVALRRVPWWIGPPLALLGGIGVVGALVADGLFGSGVQASLHGRLPVWWDARNLLAGHWLLGSGAGTFASAIERHRSDQEFHTWVHAHNDWLEWVTDTGVVGVIALVVALALVLPGRGRDGERGRAMPALVGVGAVLLHAVVDFPLKVPVIAMGVALIAAWRAAMFDVPRPAPALLVRGALVGLLGVHLVGAAWELRTARVDAARSVLARSLKGSEATAAASTLRWIAPGSWELQIVDARELALAGDRAGALATLATLAETRHREPRALRTAARMYAALGETARAAELAEALITLAPADSRNWVSRAEILQEAGSERAPAAWADALNRRAPRAMEKCWEVLPVGIYWVDATSDGPVEVRLAVANFLRAHDPDASALAFASARMADPSLFPPAYADVLIASDRLDEAAAYLDEARAAHPRDPDLIREVATLRERQGRWADALALWASVPSPDAQVRFRVLMATREVEGPGPALEKLLASQMVGEKMTAEALILRADLERELGRSLPCRQTLGSQGVRESRRYKVEAREMASRCDDMDAPRWNPEPTRRKR